MLRKKAWFVLVLLAIMLPTTLAAQEMMHGKWWNYQETVDKLELTDSERKILDEKYTASRRKMIDLKSAVEKERLEMDVILDNPNADKARIREHYDRLEQARTQLSKERFEFLMEVRDIIGVERFQELKAMHRGMRGRGMDGRSKDRSGSRGRY